MILVLGLVLVCGVYPAVGRIARLWWRYRKEDAQRAARVTAYFARRVAEADEEHEHETRLLAAHEDDVCGPGYRGRASGS